MSDRRSSVVRELEGTTLRELEAELDEYRRQRRKAGTSVIPGPPGIHIGGRLRMWWHWERDMAGPLSSDDSGLLTAWSGSETGKLLLEINVHQFPGPARDVFWKEVDHLLNHLRVLPLPEKRPPWFPKTKETLDKWRRCADIYRRRLREYEREVQEGVTEAYRPTARDFVDMVRAEGIGYKERTCSNIIRSIKEGWI